jgi:chromosome segregation ATPase
MRSTFDIVRRGYDCVQVDYQLEQLRAELQIAVTDRDAGAAQAMELTRALEAAREEIDDLHAQLKRLAAPPTTVEGMSERVVRMLRTAHKEAAETTPRPPQPRTRSGPTSSARQLPCVPATNR